MNNKGFTLVEVLTVVVVISIISFVVVKQIGSTLSLSKENSYQIMKNNIRDITKSYITECNNKIIKCNLNWDNNQTSIEASELKNGGYFSDFTSPIDGKDLSHCLIINIYRNNGVIKTELIDNCY